MPSWWVCFLEVNKLSHYWQIHEIWHRFNVASNLKATRNAATFGVYLLVLLLRDASTSIHTLGAFQASPSMALSRVDCFINQYIPGIPDIFLVLIIWDTASAIWVVRASEATRSTLEGLRSWLIRLLLSFLNWSYYVIALIHWEIIHWFLMLHAAWLICSRIYSLKDRHVALILALSYALTSTYNIRIVHLISSQT